MGGGARLVDDGARGAEARGLAIPRLDRRQAAPVAFLLEPVDAQDRPESHRHWPGATPGRAPPDLGDIQSRRAGFSVASRKRSRTSNRPVASYISTRCSASGRRQDLARRAGPTRTRRSPRESAPDARERSPGRGWRAGASPRVVVPAEGPRLRFQVPLALLGLPVRGQRGLRAGVGSGRGRSAAPRPWLRPFEGSALRNAFSAAVVALDAGGSARCAGALSHARAPEREAPNQELPIPDRLVSADEVVESITALTKSPVGNADLRSARHWPAGDPAPTVGRARRTALDPSASSAEPAPIVEASGGGRTAERASARGVGGRACPPSAPPAVRIGTGGAASAPAVTHAIAALAQPEPLRR